MYRIYQTQLLLSQSLASDFESPVWDVSAIAKGALEIAWADVNSTDSTFKLQGSVLGVSWVDVANSEIAIDSVGDGGYVYDFTAGTGLNKLKLVYSHGTNSAGSMTAVTNNKVERNGDNPGGS